MGHRRILGKTTDFISGKEIVDTDDERYRQKLARFLVEEKGYAKADIEAKRRLEFLAGDEKAFSMIDFIITLDGRPVIAIKYGPGSLVTRERSSLAAARILEPLQVPLTVVTNGEDAEILDTTSGDVMSTGLGSIPDKNTAIEFAKNNPPRQLSPEQREVEARVLAAYDWLEHSLECDDDWCRTD